MKYFALNKKRPSLLDAVLKEGEEPPKWFQIFPLESLYFETKPKGDVIEITVLTIHDKEKLATIDHPNDPAWSIEGNFEAFLKIHIAHINV